VSNAHNLETGAAHGRKQPRSHLSVCARASTSDAAPEKLVPKPSDQATAMPKLYIVTSNEAPGLFFCDIVTGADQIDRGEDAPVRVNHIGSISCNLRRFLGRLKRIATDIGAIDLD
jgi:hypothetical protein